jgi:hypothetical protein
MTRPEDHLDLDAVAAIDEGLDQDADRREHAESCRECSRRLAQVRTTRALLSALPREAMPEDVADRVHAALPPEPLSTTIVPTGRRRRWTSSPALAGLVAAAAAVALVAAISIGALRSGHDTGGAGSPACAGIAAAPPHASTNFPVLTSGARYTDTSAAMLVDQLDLFVRRPSPPTPSGLATPSKSGARSDALTFSAHAAVPPALKSLYADRQQVLACARLLAGEPVTPLAVDFARFSGGLRHLTNAPALVILLPRANGVRDGAWIVGPRCTTDPSQDLYAFQAVIS